MDDQTPFTPISPTNNSVSPESSGPGSMPPTPEVPGVAAPGPGTPSVSSFDPALSNPTPNPMPQLSVAPNVPPQPAVVMPSSPSPMVGSAMGKRRKLPIIMVILFAVVVLLGGSAAAYFGIIVPNKPENVLKTAFHNTIKQESSTSQLLIEGKPDKTGPAYKIEGTLKGKRTKPIASDADIKVTVSGVSVSGQVRLVDKSLYLKVGDLSTIAGLVGVASPDMSQALSQINSKVANQWIEFDSTLLNTAGASCVLDTDFTFSQADIDLMDQLYQKHPFISITNHSADTVNGNSATKYQLKIDDNKGGDFFAGFKDLPLVKKLENCSKTDKNTDGVDKDITNDIDTNSLKDNDTTSFTVWVDKKTKLINKLAVDTADQKDQNGASGSLTLTMSYGPVSIEKPAGSKPFAEVLSELTGLFQENPFLQNSLGQF